LSSGGRSNCRSSLQHTLRNEALIHGIYLGIILIIVITSFLYRIRLQEPLYGYYLCYVLCLAYQFLDMYGYTHEFIFTQRTWYLPVATRICNLLLFPCNAGILSLMLDLRKIAPRFDRWFRRLCFGLAALGTLLSLSGFQTQIILPVQFLLLSAIGISFAVSIRFFRQSSGARLYLLAFGILLLAGMKDIFSNLGISPFMESLRDLFMISSILHITTLNFVIIGKLAHMRKEKHTAEAALLSERQRVEQQRQFLRLLSHELRTPLAIIDSTAQILPLLRQDPAKHAQKTTAIHAATQRMKVLMDKCLLDERLSMEGVVSEMQTTDLRALLRNLVDRVRSETDHHQVSFAPEGVPETFYCDPFLLEILMGNLLENAIKYSPAGGPVTLRGRTGSEGGLLLEVRDNGVGISPEQVERIFERFYRAGHVPGVTGAGLGLYLVRQIALLHGGEVSCSSKPGHGSIFTVTLNPVDQSNR
jgi:two-component system, sensor histidine kinase LadS